MMQTLMVKGTKTMTEKQLSTEIESMGGSIGASALEDYCEVSLNITKQYFDEAFKLFADVVQNPAFPEDELKKEKVNMIAGIKSRQDQIFSVTYDCLRSAVYHGHPYTYLTTGTEEGVNNITRGDLQSWHGKHYGTQNMIMVVTGNIGLGEIKSAVKNYLGTMPPVEPLKYEFPAVEPVAKEIAEKKKFEQAYLMYGYLVPSVSDNDFPKIKVLNAYLGSGMSSLLFQELREKAGLGYEVSSFYPSKKDKSTFIIYIGLDKSTMDTAKTKIEALISDLKTKPLDETRLRDAKKYIKGISVLDHQTGSKQAWYLGWWEIMGKGYRYDKKYLSDIEQVTSADVKAMIDKYLTDKFVQVQITPEK